MRVILVLSWALTTASGQTPEAVVLGAPCASESGFPSELVKKHSAAERRRDRESQIQLAKEIVRHACSNDHWWLKLAETYQQVDRADEAIRVLDVYYDRGGANAVDARLRDKQWSLWKLANTDAFRRSTLAKKIAGDRGALARRRQEAQARLSKEPHPPELYIAKNACPFECCTFRSWSVKADTVLYDKPNGTKVVGRAIEGTRVRGLTGEVHLRPAPVVVRFPNPEGFQAKPGAIVYLLNYTGEGHGIVWHNGNLVDSEVLSVAEHCPNPEAECWGEFVNPEDVGTQRKHEWWVKVRTSKGVVGWTQQSDNFGDKDSCA